MILSLGCNFLNMKYLIKNFMLNQTIYSSISPLEMCHNSTKRKYLVIEHSLCFIEFHQLYKLTLCTYIMDVVMSTFVFYYFIRIKDYFNKIDFYVLYKERCLSGIRRTLQSWLLESKIYMVSIHGIEKMLIFSIVYYRYLILKNRNTNASYGTVP